MPSAHTISVRHFLPRWNLSCAEALFLVPAFALALVYEFFGHTLGKTGIPLPTPAFFGAIPNFQLKLFPMETFLLCTALLVLIYARPALVKREFPRLTIFVIVLVAFAGLRALPDFRANPILVIRNSAFAWYLLLPLMISVLPISSRRWEGFFRNLYGVCFVYSVFSIVQSMLTLDPGKNYFPVDLGFALAFAYGVCSTAPIVSSSVLFILGAELGLGFVSKMQRTNLLGLAVSVGLMGVLYFLSDRFPKLQWKRLPWLGLGFGVCLALMVGFHGVGGNRTESAHDGQKLGAFQKAESGPYGAERFRSYLWRDAWNMFRSSPFAGIGFYRPVVYRVYAGKGEFWNNEGSFEFRSQGNQSTTSPPIAGPHNSYLNALARLGILGLGFLALHLFCGWFFLVRGYYACLFILLAQMMYAFFNVGLEGPVHSFPLLLLLGAGLKISREDAAAKRNKQPARKSLSSSRRLRVGLVHVPYQLAGGEDMHVSLLRNGYQALGIEPVSIPSAGMQPNLKLALRALTLGEPAAWDQLMRENSIDFLHIHNIHPALGPAFLSWIRERGLPTLMTVHNHRFYCTNGLALLNAKVCKDCLGHQSFWRPVLRNCNGSLAKSAYHSAALTEIQHGNLLSEAVNRFLAPSPYIAKELEAAGLPSAKIQILPHPISVAEVSTKKAEDVDVAFVGRFSLEKGILQLLAAAERLPNLQFALVGQGPLEEQVRKEAGKNVRLLGGIPRPEALAVMRAAKVVCVPSVCHESFSLVAAEAAALGARLVVPANESFRHFVGPPFNAITADPTNPESLAQGINLALAQAWRTEAERAELRDQFGLERYQERLRQTVEELLS
jgi:glycosyltransferase involved in cell wall biosynthesis/O-antigen ligase